MSAGEIPSWARASHIPKQTHHGDWNLRSVRQKKTRVSRLITIWLTQILPQIPWVEIHPKAATKIRLLHVCSRFVSCCLLANEAPSWGWRMAVSWSIGTGPGQILNCLNLRFWHNCSVTRIRSFSTAPPRAWACSRARWCLGALALERMESELVQSEVRRPVEVRGTWRLQRQIYPD